MISEANFVAMYVKRKIDFLRDSQENRARASLANLRRGIGRAPGAIPDLWELTLSDLPEVLLSRDGEPTYGEWAIHTTLTLFALHQQGKDLHTNCMNNDSFPLGRAIRSLVKKDEDMPRIKRRFDAAATAGDLKEFSHHLRGLVQLLKAADIPLDYVQMAKDLYFYQISNTKDNVRLRWGQDFYFRTKDNKDQSKDTSLERGN